MVLIKIWLCLDNVIMKIYSVYANKIMVMNLMIDGLMLNITNGMIIYACQKQIVQVTFMIACTSDPLQTGCLY